MWRGFVVVAVFDALGELIARGAHVPLPGSVVGMALLLVFLVVYRRAPAGLDAAADFLLRHLALFFVPATVGALCLVPQLAPEGRAVVVALVVSTLLGLAVAALVFQIVAKDRV